MYLCEMYDWVAGAGGVRAHRLKMYSYVKCDGILIAKWGQE